MMKKGYHRKLEFFFEYIGFYFRRFLVEELWDSELGWMRYKIPKFYGRTGMKDLKLFLIFG
jgi:hypothetical protein